MIELARQLFTSAQKDEPNCFAVQLPLRQHHFGDHLSTMFSKSRGSTSLTTDANGAKVSEIRYKPWREIRYAWTVGLTTTPAYELTKYTLRQAQGSAFTGKYSYMDDPSTAGVTKAPVIP